MDNKNKIFSLLRDIGFKEINGSDFTICTYMNANKTYYTILVYHNSDDVSISIVDKTNETDGPVDLEYCIEFLKSEFKHELRKKKIEKINLL